MGFGPEAGVVGLLAPNVLVLAAIVMDVKQGEGVHAVFRFGLPISLAIEGGTILLTPTFAGHALASALAWTGRLLAGLY